MPNVNVPDHTHRYSSYLLTLRNHWAYAGTGRLPGRTQEEKTYVASDISLHSR